MDCLNSELNHIAELTNEVAALRCALHSLTHALITPGATGREAIGFFDSLARQWQSIERDYPTNSAVRDFSEYSGAIRNQIIAAIERQERQTTIQ